MKECGAKSKQNQKRTIIFLIFSMLTFLTGCFEELELDQKVIVSMVGIDQTKEDRYRVTMGLIDTRSIEEREPEAIHVYTFEGESIFEAVRLSILSLGKQPQWPYMKVLVFGPAFKETDVTPVLDYFNRNNEIQPNPFIAFSHELAEDIIKLRADLSNIPAVIVEEQFALQNYVGYTPSMELHNFTELMLTPDRVGFAGIIKKSKQEDKQVPMLEGSAIIKEGKWIGDLSNIETRGFLWVRKEVRGGIIVVLDVEEVGKIGLEIQERRTISIDPIMKNGDMLIQINIKQGVRVSEIMGFVDQIKPAELKIQKKVEEELTKEIEGTIEKARQWKTDIFGFNRIIHQKYPKYYQEHKDNWGETFATLPIEINVDININTMGLIE